MKWEYINGKYYINDVEVTKEEYEDTFPKPNPEPINKNSMCKKIHKGEYFEFDNNLYIATTEIPVGDAINPSVNCTQTDIETVLNTINA